MSRKSELVRGFGLAMSIGAALDEIRRALGVSEEEFHVLGTPDGRPHLEKMIAGLKAPVVEVQKSKVYLRQLYVDETISIGSTDGTRTIAQAKDVFIGHLDSDFANWGLDVPAAPTQATKVEAYELVEDGTFQDIYESLNRPFEALCLTQHQIIEFCVKHKDKLCQSGHGTFFLFQVEGKFFVASVSVYSDGHLLMYVRSFSSACVWNAEFHRRFVLPQLRLDRFGF